MKNAKERSRTQSSGIKGSGIKSSKPVSPAREGPRKTMDLGELRQQIDDLVRHEALGMVESTIEEVGKGHYLGMKYLFEVIGLYPAAVTDEPPVQDSLAATLLRRLGLPETPMPEEKVTKGSETPAGAKDDGLE